MHDVGQEIGHMVNMGHNLDPNSIMVKTLDSTCSGHLSPEWVGAF